MVDNNPAKPVCFLGKTKANLKSTMDVQIQMALMVRGALLSYLRMAVMFVGVESGVTVTWPIGNAQGHQFQGHLGRPT